MRSWGIMPKALRLRPFLFILLLIGSAGARHYLVNVPVGKGPLDVLVNPNLNKVYSADARGGSVTVIDGNTNQVLATIRVPYSPAAIACNALNNKVYFSAAGSPYLAVVDGDRNSLIIRQYLGRGVSVTALCSNTSTNNLYCASKDQVLVVDGTTNEVLELIPVEPNQYSAMCYNPVNNRVYVAGDSSPGITVIDCATNTAASAIATTTRHHAMCWDRKDNRIYCAGPGRVDVVDCAHNCITGTILLRDSAPAAVCYDPVNNRVYCPGGRRSQRVYVINCTTGDTTSFVAGNAPSAAVADPIRNQVYVTTRKGEELLVIDNAKNTWTSVALGKEPFALAVNPATGIAYVAEGDNDCVSAVIETPSETDIRIDQVTKKQWNTPFGTIMLNPGVTLRSTGFTHSGFTLRLEIYDVTDSATAIHVPVYAESLVVWELMTRTQVAVQFPEYSPEPGKYEVVAQIMGFPDASPAGNRKVTHWAFAVPSQKIH